MLKFSNAIVFVSNMDRSVAFYRDALGLKLRFQSEHWSEFDTPGVTLALHLAQPASGADGDKTVAGRCEIGFDVPDLDACHRELLAKGVRCIRAPKVEDFGAKLAHYSDPDGLTITICERK
ncbi:MAG: VOC family protein [Planctomycetia bacterium]|nr:VOC family protein [Planctomycetia bacterium]